MLSMQPVENKVTQFMLAPNVMQLKIEIMFLHLDTMKSPTKQKHLLAPKSVGMHMSLAHVVTIQPMKKRQQQATLKKLSLQLHPVANRKARQKERSAQFVAKHLRHNKQFLQQVTPKLSMQQLKQLAPLLARPKVSIVPSAMKSLSSKKPLLHLDTPKSLTRQLHLHAQKPV